MSLKPSVNDERLPALSFDILQATFNEIFISWLTHQCTHLYALTLPNFMAGANFHC